MKYHNSFQELRTMLENSELDEFTQNQVLHESLSHLHGQFDKKALNTAAFISNLKLELTSVKEVQDRLTKRSSMLTKQVLYLNNYLLEQLQVMNVTNLRNEQLTMAVKQNPCKVIIDDEDSVPPEFKEIISTIKISKTTIGEQLKAGIEIDGCRLERTHRLEIK
ncbi:MAG: siphovirus Gp157 family protein [Methylococcaceae bacterium]